MADKSIKIVDGSIFYRYKRHRLQLSPIKPCENIKWKRVNAQNSKKKYSSTYDRKNISAIRVEREGRERERGERERERGERERERDGQTDGQREREREREERG